MIANPLTLHVTWRNGHHCYDLPEKAGLTEMQFELLQARRAGCRLMVETATEYAFEVLDIDSDGALLLDVVLDSDAAIDFLCCALADSLWPEYREGKVWFIPTPAKPTAAPVHGEVDYGPLSFNRHSHH